MSRENNVDAAVDIFFKQKSSERQKQNLAELKEHEVYLLASEQALLRVASKSQTEHISLRLSTEYDFKKDLEEKKKRERRKKLDDKAKRDINSREGDLRKKSVHPGINKDLFSIRTESPRPSSARRKTQKIEASKKTDREKNEQSILTYYESAFRATTRVEARLAKLDQQEQDSWIDSDSGISSILYTTSSKPTLEEIYNHEENSNFGKLQPVEFCTKEESKNRETVLKSVEDLTKLFNSEDRVTKWTDISNWVQQRTQVANYDEPRFNEILENAEKLENEIEDSSAEVAVSLTQKEVNKKVKIEDFRLKLKAVKEEDNKRRFLHHQLRKNEIEGKLSTEISELKAAAAYTRSEIVQVKANIRKFDGDGTSDNTKFVELEMRLAQKSRRLLNTIKELQEKQSSMEAQIVEVDQVLIELRSQVGEFSAISDMASNLDSFVRKPLESGKSLRITVDTANKSKISDDGIPEEKTHKKKQKEKKRKKKKREKKEKINNQEKNSTEITKQDSARTSKSESRQRDDTFIATKLKNEEAKERFRLLKERALKLESDLNNLPTEAEREKKSKADIEVLEKAIIEAKQQNKKYAAQVVNLKSQLEIEKIKYDETLSRQHASEANLFKLKNDLEEKTKRKERLEKRLAVLLKLSNNEQAQGGTNSENLGKLQGPEGPSGPRGRKNALSSMFKNLDLTPERRATLLRELKTADAKPTPNSKRSSASNGRNSFRVSFSSKRQSDGLIPPPKAHAGSNFIPNEIKRKSTTDSGSKLEIVETSFKFSQRKSTQLTNVTKSDVDNAQNVDILKKSDNGDLLDKDKVESSFDDAEKINKSGKVTTEIKGTDSGSDEPSMSMTTQGFEERSQPKVQNQVKRDTNTNFVNMDTSVTKAGSGGSGMSWEEEVDITDIEEEVRHWIECTYLDLDKKLSPGITVGYIARSQEISSIIERPEEETIESEISVLKEEAQQLEEMVVDIKTEHEQEKRVLEKTRAKAQNPVVFERQTLQKRNISLTNSVRRLKKQIEEESLEQKKTVDTIKRNAENDLALLEAELEEISDLPKLERKLKEMKTKAIKEKANSIQAKKALSKQVLMQAKLKTKIEEISAEIDQCSKLSAKERVKLSKKMIRDLVKTNKKLTKKLRTKKKELSSLGRYLGISFIKSSGPTSSKKKTQYTQEEVDKLTELKDTIRKEIVGSLRKLAKWRKRWQEAKVPTTQFKRTTATQKAKPGYFTYHNQAAGSTSDQPFEKKSITYLDNFTGGSGNDNLSSSDNMQNKYHQSLQHLNQQYSKTVGTKKVLVKAFNFGADLGPLNPKFQNNFTSDPYQNIETSKHVQGNLAHEQRVKRSNLTNFDFGSDDTLSFQSPPIFMTKYNTNTNNKVVKGPEAHLAAAQTRMLQTNQKNKVTNFKFDTNITPLTVGNTSLAINLNGPKTQTEKEKPNRTSEIAPNTKKDLGKDIYLRRSLPGSKQKTVSSENKKQQNSFEVKARTTKEKDIAISSYKASSPSKGRNSTSQESDSFIISASKGRNSTLKELDYRVEHSDIKVNSFKEKQKEAKSTKSSDNHPESPKKENGLLRNIFQQTLTDATPHQRKLDNMSKGKLDKSMNASFLQPLKTVAETVNSKFSTLTNSADTRSSENFAFSGKNLGGIKFDTQLGHWPSGTSKTSLNTNYSWSQGLTMASTILNNIKSTDSSVQSIQQPLPPRDIGELGPLSRLSLLSPKTKNITKAKFFG